MDPDRRTLLRTGVAAAAALTTGNGALAQLQSAAEETPAFEGNFTRAADALAAAAEDFGHIVRRLPWGVLKPASTADIVEVMQWAGRHGMKVAARGQGHSTYGRAMTDGGIVVDMGAMSTIGSVGPDRVVVGAGAPWESVLAATLAHGLTPPVLTDYLGLSVGGTLAVGGIGGSTSRYGMQVDNVLELDVVTGDGRELTCSADRNPELFDALRAGYGQCGIVTRATLRLVRPPERVRVFQLSYPGLRALAADQRLALADGRFDQLQGAVIPDDRGAWRYQLSGAVFYDTDTMPDEESVLAGLSDDRPAAEIADLAYREHAGAFARLERMLRSNGQWFNPHPWLMTFVPGVNAETIASEILSGLTAEDIGAFGRVIYYPIHTAARRAPLFRLPDGDVAFVFNLVRVPESGDAGAAGEMVARNRVLYERIRDAGGVLYPVSALPMSGGDWKRHLGPAWPLLQRARQQYDPNSILTPGYEIA